jgi:hypothetical protein
MRIVHVEIPADDPARRRPTSLPCRRSTSDPQDRPGGGGTVVAPKMAVPGVGWTAYFADPEGNAFGVMEFDPAAA